jgi:chorismate mutase
MKKSLVFAVMMAIATTCAANNENAVSENVAEPVENVVEEVLATIDGDIVCTTFYADKDNLYLVEYGTRFIRVRDFRTRELVHTLSIYLCKENGSLVDGANSVMRDASGTFVPAKAIRTAKGMKYQAAFCSQMIPVNRVKQLEKATGIRI